MAVAVETPRIDTIRSLFEIESFATPVIDGKRKVLVLDLDLTLMRLVPTLGDEHFQDFLHRNNATPGMHYLWLNSFLDQIPSKACETAEKVNALIHKFHEQMGWEVIVITSRKEQHREVTMSCVYEAKLKIKSEDIIFTDGEEKDTHFTIWNGSRPDPEEVIFVDDQWINCFEMARLGKHVKAFEYTMHQVNGELTNEQMRQLVVQLAALDARESIPFKEAYEEDEVTQAMRALEITELTEKNLYGVILAKFLKES